MDPVAAYHDPERPAPGARPWVLVNMVASVDGATAVDGRSGPLGGDTDRSLLGILRGLADVVLVGAGTVRAEGYGPPRTPPTPVAERRTARNQAPRPRLAVMSGRLDLDPAAPLFTGGDPSDPPPLVYTTSAAPAERLAALAGVAEVVVADGERVEPAWLLADLHAHGAGTVVCEGGPGLNGQLARAGLVDEWCVTVSPRLVGGGAGLLAGPPVTSPLPLRLAHVLAEDGFLFCRWLAG